MKRHSERTSGRTRVRKLRIERLESVLLLSGTAQVDFLDGQLLHLDSSVASSLMGDASATRAVPGERIAVWQDLSPADNDVQQDEAARRPTLVHDAIDGRPAVRFSGEEFLASVRDVGIGGSASRSLFVVARPESSTTTNVIGWGESSYGSAFDVYMRNDSSGMHVHGGRSPGFSGTPGETRIVSYVYDAQQQSATMNVNGVTKGHDRVLSTVDTRLSVGSGAYEPYNYFQGDIAEVLVYNRALDDETRQEIEHELREKWQADHSPREVLHLDASAVDSIHQSTESGDDSGDVTLWRDLSGAGNNVVQNDHPRMPEFISDSGSGRPAIRFQGDQFLTTQETTGIDGGESRSMFVVASSHAAAPTNVLGWGRSSPGATFDLTMRGGGTAMHYHGPADAAVIGGFAGDVRVVSYVYDALSSIAWMGLGSRLDQYQFALATDDTQVKIGAGAYAAYNFFQGDLFEVVIFDGALSPHQRRLVESRLIEKWRRGYPAEPQVTSGAGFAFDLAAEDPPGLTYEVISSPVHGALIAGREQRFQTYVAADGFVGRDQFTYAVLSDETTRRTVTVPIDVTSSIESNSPYYVPGRRTVGGRIGTPPVARLTGLRLPYDAVVVSAWGRTVDRIRSDGTTAWRYQSDSPRGAVRANHVSIDADGHVVLSGGSSIRRLHAQSGHLLDVVDMTHLFRETFFVNAVQAGYVVGGDRDGYHRVALVSDAGELLWMSPARYYYPRWADVRSGALAVANTFSDKVQVMDMDSRDVVFLADLRFPNDVRFLDDDTVLVAEEHGDTVMTIDIRTGQKTWIVGSRAGTALGSLDDLDLGYATRTRIASDPALRIDPNDAWSRSKSSSVHAGQLTLYAPNGAIQLPDGSFYIADTDNNRVVRVVVTEQGPRVASELSGFNNPEKVAFVPADSPQTTAPIDGRSIERIDRGRGAANGRQGPARNRRE